MYNHYYIESCKGIITSFYYNINKLLVTESNCIIFGTGRSTQMYSSSSLSPRGLGLTSESMSGNSAMSLKTPTKELKFGLQLRRDSQDVGPEGEAKPVSSSSEMLRVVREPCWPWAVFSFLKTIPEVLPEVFGASRR